MASRLLLVLLLWSSACRADPILIAWIGDSITYGAPTRMSIPPPHRLELLLNAAHPGAYAVGSFGISSTVTSQHKTTWTNSIRSRGYDVLVILSGVNDMITDVTGATAWTNIDFIVTQALADGLQVVLITVLPWKGYSSWTAGRQTETDALLTSIRARAGVTLVEAYPTWESVAGSDTMRTDWDDNDGLHPDATGSDALASQVKNAMGL